MPSAYVRVGVSPIQTAIHDLLQVIAVLVVSEMISDRNTSPSVFKLIMFTRKQNQGLPFIVVHTVM